MFHEHHLAVPNQVAVGVCSTDSPCRICATILPSIKEDRLAAIVAAATQRALGRSKRKAPIAATLDEPVTSKQRAPEVQSRAGGAVAGMVCVALVAVVLCFGVRAARTSGWSLGLRAEAARQRHGILPASVPQLIEVRSKTLSLLFPCSASEKVPVLRLGPRRV